MHKFRKALLSLFLFPLSLFSCGNNKYYGYYMFQLGEEKGDHFGFHITLTENEYQSQKPEEKGKLFKFGMKATGAFLPKDPGEYDPENPPEDLGEYVKAKFLFTAVTLLNTENGGTGVNGYYNIGKKDVNDKGRPLDLNIIITLPIEIEDREDLKNALKKLVIAYVDGKNVNAILPVSLDDIFYQLAWYGYFVSIGTEYDPDDPLSIIQIVDLTDPTGTGEPKVTLPGKQGLDRLDTHPTDSERDQMNEMFGPGKTYHVTGWTDGWFERDFHTLTATLIKQ